MDSASVSQNATTPAPARRRSRLVRVARVLSLLALLVLVLLAAAPWLLSRTVLRGEVEKRVAAELGGPVSIAECSLSWLSGLTLKKLSVASPPGFPQDPPMLALASVEGGVSWSKLARGKLSFDLHAKGLAVGIVQKADGTTNLEQARLRSERAERPTPKPPVGTGPESSSLANLRFDVTLSDSTVEVRHEQRGVIETLTAIEARAKKDFGADRLECSFAGSLPRGRVSLSATVDPTLATPLLVSFSTSGIELARYRALLTSFLQPGAITRLEGELVCQLQILVDPRNGRVTSQGTLAVTEPAVAGDLLGGVTLRAKRWDIAPSFSLALGESLPAAERRTDVSGLSADLGFVRANGLPAAESSRMLGGRAALGVAFTLDVGALAALGGPMPARLSGASGTVHGKLAVALPAGFEEWKDAAKLATSLALRLDANAENVRFSSSGAQALAACTASVSMEHGWERPFGVAFTASGLDLGECERFAGTHHCEGKVALDGSATVELGTAPWDQDRILGSLRVDSKIAAPSARIYEQSLLGYEGALKIAAGKLELASAPGKTPLLAPLLNGGPVELVIATDLDRKKLMPTSVRIGWHGGSVAAGAVPVLQYFVPMLAGVADRADLDFASKIDTTMSLQGPLLAPEGKSSLEWLNLWTGTGDLHLLDGAFTPAPALAGLLEVLGSKRQLAFKKLGGKLEIRDGFVQTVTSECEGTLSKLGIRGKTSLSGQIDYKLDVSALLSGHRDGEKIKKALGNAPLEAGLVGTLSHPRLAMPDLGKLLLKGALEGLLKR